MSLQAKGMLLRQSGVGGGALAEGSRHMGVRASAGLSSRTPGPQRSAITLFKGAPLLSCERDMGRGGGEGAGAGGEGEDREGSGAGQTGPPQGLAFQEEGLPVSAAACSCEADAPSCSIAWPDWAGGEPAGSQRGAHGAPEYRGRGRS